MKESDSIYFTTAKILDWKPLLKDDSYKNIITSSLQTLVNQNRLAVFAFVIMPNHIHIIWSENENNRKETAQVSFFKFTAHQFLHKLKSENNHFLSSFQVVKSDRNFQFWQRNILNIEVYSEKVFNQKLEYIHNNPIQEKWQLVNDPVDYKYSSASFYELGIDNFGILTDYFQI